MTVLTQANLTAQQANLETCLSKTTTLRNQAELGAAEWCGLGNYAQAELLREQSADASVAWAALQRMMARSYRILLPGAGGGGPSAPNFGDK